MGKVDGKRQDRLGFRLGLAPRIAVRKVLREVPTGLVVIGFIKPVATESISLQYQSS